MNTPTINAEHTRALLSQHCSTYPGLQTEDIFKYLYHSAFGCDHLVSNEAAALHYIQAEYAAQGDRAPDLIEPLDGAYVRVHLGVLQGGLRPQTLARLFCLSAQKEAQGTAQLEKGLEIAQQMIADGTLPLDGKAFAAQADAWRTAGFPALHHSDAFREAYRPAYRVIAKQYASILPLLTEIDKKRASGSTIVAIEGGSASGKSTLAEALRQIYNCNLFHTDDFFLQPAQRTQARLAEVGGNLDRERFQEEIVLPLLAGNPVCYRRFDCATQTLGEPITVPHAELTVVEGAYSMHPAFGHYYHLSVFLDVEPALQQERIEIRNTPRLAKRFFGEWIPMENAYFAQMRAKDRADLILHVQA